MWARWHHLVNMIKLLLLSANPSPQPKRQIDWFSHFCTPHSRVSSCITRHFLSPNNCPFAWGSGPHLMHASWGPPESITKMASWLILPYLGKPAPEGKPFWILHFTGARDDGWQWHQQDHMQIISTSLQTDNHASISPLGFLQARCPSCRPANSVKALIHAKCNNSTNTSVYGTVVIAKAIVRVHLVYVMNADICWSNQWTWAMSPPVGCYRAQPPSPFIIITLSRNWYLFYCLMESRRLNLPSHCSKDVNAVCAQGCTLQCPQCDPGFSHMTVWALGQFWLKATPFSLANEHRLPRWSSWPRSNCFYTNILFYPYNIFIF